MAKQKIAILGGGLGSMSTAFWLTSQENWQDKYEITVYQVGWRIGGKGTTGRGPDGQIYEHGLHIWIGFYDNAFRMIQAVYKELGRPPGSRLATWQEAFTPHSYVVIADEWQKQWRNWPIDFPTNDRVPGDSGEFLTIWDYLFEGLQMLIGHIQNHVELHVQLQEQELKKKSMVGTLEERVTGVVGELANYAIDEVLSLILELAQLHREIQSDGAPQDHSKLHLLVNHVHQWLIAREDSLLDDDNLRRLFIIANLGLAMTLGILEDIVGNEVHGFDEIDKFDFRDWLISHGGTDLAVWSAPIQALYDLVFAYENGEIDKPNFGAGAALLSTLRIGLDYKGAIFWKMNAGMGDTIFSPIYLVLKERGVKFEFFSRVENLGLSVDGKSVETITIGRQATLKDPGAGYQPFITVKDLPCWPANPLYDQIVEGEELREKGINLESFWTPWQSVETQTLQLGTHFDQIVLGIAVGSLAYITPELMAADSRWKAMCENVGTVRTMAMQWWLKPDLTTMGWTLQSPVMDAYVEPMNTWADMSLLLKNENWGDELCPGNLSYFCGAMVGGIPDRNDYGFPDQALADVKKVALDFANNDVGFLWPKATRPDNPKALDFSKLVKGFDEQFYRANIDPSERYVLSLKGSVTSRIKPGESGFENLFLTGDWTYNYFNAGCVEATVISGMLCSSAMTGFPPIKDIEGVRPGKWWS
jgi:uncharacterized protein with NAD-binding domain and iron-sulfur cluster